MDVAQLEAFALTARLGSISAAALELGYSQSAVSRQLQALEREFGTQLWHRTARGVRLTAHGRALLPHVRDITTALESARAELSGTAPAHTRIRIGAFPAATPTLVAALLARLEQTRPDLAITLRQAPSPALVTAVAGGDLDGALVMEGTPTRPRPHLVETALFTDEMVVLVPAEHPAAGAGTRPLTDFRADTWVEEDGRPERILAAATARTGFAPRRVRRAPDLAAKLGFVAAGLGVAMVPAVVVDPGWPRVSAVHITDPPRRGVRWVTRADRDSVGLRAVVETLRTVIESAAGAPTANSAG
jgi:DNA-binding transcriptional LysR family regulator